jgi:hypothetical protein
MSDPRLPLSAPDPEVKRSAAAIAAEKRTCANKTPLQAKEAYLPIVFRRGKLKATSEEAKMIARIAHYEQISSHDQSFVAGQLAADAYQATLPTAIGQYGYEGCIYAPVRRLERQLAPKP